LGAFAFGWKKKISLCPKRIGPVEAAPCSPTPMQPAGAVHSDASAMESAAAKKVPAAIGFRSNAEYTKVPAAMEQHLSAYLVPSCSGANHGPVPQFS